MVSILHLLAITRCSSLPSCGDLPHGTGTHILWLWSGNMGCGSEHFGFPGRNNDHARLTNVAAAHFPTCTKPSISDQDRKLQVRLSNLVLSHIGPTILSVKVVRKYELSASQVSALPLTPPLRSSYTCVSDAASVGRREAPEPRVQEETAGHRGAPSCHLILHG